ncbi:MAG: DNA polymerase I [Acidobacteria bacterium]|nr:DNA polymerase I [Acidobacteriota bacterium]
MATYMLIDGNSLTYRAFFALPTDLATASGQVTNAVYGFTSMLLNLVRDHEPDIITVAFDRPEPTFRHERLDTYKANRESAPDILRQQMGLVREVVEVLGIPMIEKVGFEADDVIATLATRARDNGDDVIVVTGDRDSYQLVEDPNIKVLYNKRGVSDYAFYDEAGIEERTGVKPVDYVQYAALRGDKSDNLPGVTGVGEKTAAKLVNTYGDIDGIYAHLDELTPKLIENLSAAEDDVRLNVELMDLIRDVPLELDPTDLVAPVMNTEEVQKLFDFLEFHSLYDRLREAFGTDLGGSTGQRQVLEAELVELSADDAVATLEAMVSGVGALAVAAAPGEPGATHSPLAGLALVQGSDSGDVVYVAAPLLDDDVVKEVLSNLLGGDRPVAAHGAKELVVWLGQNDVDVVSLHTDTMLAAYLIDPAEGRYALSDLLARYADAELPDDDEVDVGQLALGDETSSAALTAARRALGVSRLVEPLREALDAQGLSTLHDDIEVPLVRVLAKMERCGVAVDEDALRELRDRLAADCDRLRAAIIEDAGEDFNVNSTKQLREVLFEKLGLEPRKKTKTGFSTDAATLEKLRGEHPIIEHLLDYREVEKLRSTYGEGLLAEVREDGRIHATFNQTVARTGRLSSDAPNLHNIPVRSDMGRTFREVFVAPPGVELIVADYNQIELRCIAHLAEDPGLIRAFEAGDDIHSTTAAQIFAVEPSEVNHKQRSQAKMVSYGLAYGMEAYGLAQRLSISVDEATEILNAYFTAFPSVHDYMDRTVIEARERGYTETLFGRRRRIPELSSSNYRVRQAGERQAMNAGIQGLAADIFKVALVNLDRALESSPVGARLILQVHDEVILESPPQHRDEIVELTTQTMSAAFELAVPLEVNVATGPTWAAAKA